MSHSLQRVMLLDGKRKGLELWFQEGTTEFQLNTLGLDENGQARYFGYIYKVYTIWGTLALGAFQDRVTR